MKQTIPMRECASLRWLWICTAIAMTVAMGVLWRAGVKFHVGKHEAGVILFVALSWAIYERRHAYASDVARVFVNSAHGIALFVFVALAATIGSYAIACFGRGFADGTVVAMDHMIGADWMALYNFEWRHPMVMPLARAVYGMIAYSPILLLTGLALYRREDHIGCFLKGYALSLCLTLLVFAFFPMQSALVHLVGNHPPYMPATGNRQAVVITLLQNGNLHEVAIDDMIGLIGFPSFHAAAAVLYMWGAWPVRVYRYPMVAINLAMIAATPVEGAHYISDVIAGLVVAACSIACVLLVERYGQKSLHISFRPWSSSPIYLRSVSGSVPR